MFFVCPSKFCISIVSSFSRYLQWSQEKTKTMLMQNLGGTNKEYYGIFRTGLLGSLNKDDGNDKARKQ